MRRKIFYIPGFDPRSEAYYKKRLLSQFPEVKAAMTPSSAAEVCYVLQDIQVDYEILSWHKAVRAHWAKGFWPNLRNVKTIFTEYVFKGTWGRLFKVSKRDGVQKAFSVYFFFIWILLAALGVFGLVYAVWSGVDWFALAFFLGLFLAANAGFYLALKQLNLFWVNRIKCFFVEYAHKTVPDVWEYEQAFKAKIEQALNCGKDGERYDEVVLVAHSVGSILCMNLLAQWTQESFDAADGCVTRLDNLTVVTLGHCVTGVSILPTAGWFNETLRQLSLRSFKWIDVTSAKDAVTFYKVSPGYHHDVRPDLTLSARFYALFDADYYRSLKWRFYDVHFLYLDKPDFVENSEFNFEKLLVDAKLFKRLFLRNT